MRPALSVLFFTTLAGAAQGLVLALFLADWAALHAGAAVAPGFRAVGGVVAAGLATAGLVASFFHLGHPERAWRAVTQWRTSWLSREVIVLPVFIVLTLAYAAADWIAPGAAFAAGALASAAALVLFVCTGMIYACIRFLREWATPLTPLNFTLLGCAAGFTLAAALAALTAPTLLAFFARAAIAFVIAALLGRVVAWRRNASLAPKSTLQTAIGIKHGRIEQTSQGFMGGSFNTREFFHGRSASTLRAMRLACVVLGFALPLVLLLACLATPAVVVPLLLLAVGVQYAGQLAERWLFFAEANHPQNLYYQRIS